MSAPKLIESDKAPGAVGPYSQALAGAGLIFTSGQLPIDPKTKAMPEDIKAQASMALENLRNVLQAGGSDLGKVLKTTVYLADIKDFPAVNEVYATFFGKPFPARSCFAVRDLPLGARIEVEAVALA
ncbi:Endoribonuclease L-PSP [uncultured delta proteobacterium]|uniref:Endoribonuclease L-PSP n=1 Tax=uncultured delta proteobacterium TaxID=34034 RepID=A0A212JBX5_9DELT|nr:Endoribonuclease L-PSP [uncultured delta proteobacterium]